MKVNIVNSCCGSQAYIYTLNSPVLKTHIELFKDRGFSVLEQYEKVGILQAVKQGLTVTVSYNQKKANIRCSGKNCNSLITELNDIFSSVESDEKTELKKIEE